MARNYARWDSANIGAGLAVVNSGLEVVSLGDTLQGHARVDIAPQAGIAGAEIVLYAPGGDTAYQAALGFVDESAPASAVPGEIAGSVAWRIADGVLRANGVQIAASIEIPPLQTTLGLSIDETRSPPRARWYVEDRLVVYADLNPSGATSDGVWLADESNFALVDDTGAAFAFL